MNQLLQNIVALSFIECRLLQNLTIVPGRGVMLNFWRNFQELPLVGLASGEVVSKVEDKSRKFTTTLTALLSEHFDVANRHLAFLVTTADGDRYLVGNIERPFPIVDTSDSLPGKASEPSGCTLTVKYTDTTGLLKVLD